MFFLRWVDIPGIVLTETEKVKQGAKQGTVIIILIVLIIGKASTVRF